MKINYDEISINELHELIKKGDTDAACELGIRFLYGTGGAEKNPRMAYTFLQKAEQAGNKRAYQSIAFMYYNGIYFDRDEERGAEYVRKSKTTSKNKGQQGNKGIKEKFMAMKMKNIAIIGMVIVLCIIATVLVYPRVNQNDYFTEDEWGKNEEYGEVDDEMMKEDIREHDEIFSCVETSDLVVTRLEIRERKTKTDKGIDSIKVAFVAEDKYIYYFGCATMIYTKYDQGWMCDTYNLDEGSSGISSLGRVFCSEEETQNKDGDVLYVENAVLEWGDIEADFYDSYTDKTFHISTTEKEWYEDSNGHLHYICSDGPRDESLYSLDIELYEGRLYVRYLSHGGYFYFDYLKNASFE